MRGVVQQWRRPASLVPTPRAPPGKKQSGEQSRISWTYSLKQWKTNEIARTLIITQYLPYNLKIYSSIQVFVLF